MLHQSHFLLIKDDTIWIADNFMQKTLANGKENPYISVFLYDSDSKKCLQVKGTVDIRTRGDDYETMKKMVQEKKPGLPAKSLLIVKITEVYEYMPGLSAGKKIL
jgi:predicted pyridoxine 5'-phosphate oxidase superfamily flavin-nucleotide-binding protein